MNFRRSARQYNVNLYTAYMLVNKLACQVSRLHRSELEDCGVKA